MEMMQSINQIIAGNNRKKSIIGLSFSFLLNIKLMNKH